VIPPLLLLQARRGPNRAIAAEIGISDKTVAVARNRTAENSAVAKQPSDIARTGDTGGRKS
jgi:FixJ family two-component response regulator